MPLANNPIAKVDPNGAKDEWVERNGEVVWDENVTSATDPDLQPGDKYLGKEGYGLNDNSQAVHYRPDGTVRKFTQTLAEVSVKPDGTVYKSSNPSISTNNRTGYIYNDRDLEVRNAVFATTGPITTAIQKSEAAGVYWILNEEDYWIYHGHTNGNMLLMYSCIRMADGLAGGGGGRMKNTRGYRPNSIAPAPVAPQGPVRDNSASLKAWSQWYQQSFDNWMGSIPTFE